MADWKSFEALARSLRPAEAAALQEKLWQLLAQRAALYTGGASSSLPAETAQELLAGICFLLDLGPHTPPDRLRRLLETDLARRLAFGIQVTEGKLHLAQRRWAAACAGAPRVPCRALRDTLAALSAFPQQYDLRFFAHRVPCMIDYQLACPVPPALQGVDYLNEYLRRLQLEQELLGRFGPAALERLLHRLAPDPEEELMALYEPAAACALGLVLAGQSPDILADGPPPRAVLDRRLAPLPDAALRALLEQAAQQLARHCALSGEAAHYLAAFALELAPRLRAAWPDETNAVFWNWLDNA